MAVYKRGNWSTQGSCCWDVVEAGFEIGSLMPKPGLLRGCYPCRGEPLFTRYEAESKNQDVLHATTGLSAIECGQVGQRVEDLNLLGDACGMNTEDLKCFFFLYCNIVDIVCHMSVQYSDATSLPPVTRQHCYKTIDYNPYAVPFIPMIYSFYNRKQWPPTPFIHFAHPHSPPLWRSPVCSLCLCKI